MKVGLAFGSNLGDRLKNLQQARAYVLSLSNNGWSATSPLYETEPQGCPPNSPKFLNAVMEIEFAGEPRKLLEKILGYEVEHGRDRELPKNAARTIDIDILYFGEKEIVEQDLIVPHPRMTERRFVLLPLSTIEPELVVKGAGKTVQTLLRELQGGEEEVKFVQQDW
jgi:2-amino-4-hydroxy-6-hydroxymethyldihydropteridine diphosphokinase